MKYWVYKDLCQIPGLRFHIFYGLFGGDSWDEHSHEFGELVLIRRGTGVHVSEQGEYPIGVGDVFYVKPNEVHGYRGMSGLHYCDIVFDPALFLDPYPELLALAGYQAIFHVEPRLRMDHQFTSKLHLDGPSLHRAFELVEWLNTEYEGRSPGCEAAIRSLLLLLVTHLARQYAQPGSAHSRTVIGVARAVSYLESNYQEEIHLDDVIEAACMSKSSLMRAFQQCYHTSPLHYLNEFRLRKAADRLHRETVSVTRIAADAGFSDTNYFSRLFRRSYGLSPREYRRNRPPDPGPPLQG